MRAPSLHPLATLTRVESALLLREPAAVAFTLLLPLVLLTLNGSAGNAPDPRFGGAGLTDVLMPGFIVYVIAIRGGGRWPRRARPGGTARPPTSC